MEVVAELADAPVSFQVVARATGCVLGAGLIDLAFGTLQSGSSGRLKR